MSTTIIDNIVTNSAGRFLTITFRKNNGKLRTINGRTGVKYHGDPASPRFDGKVRPYYLVWSVSDRGYRRIRADTITRIASDGVVLYTAKPVAI